MLKRDTVHIAVFPSAETFMPFSDVRNLIYNAGQPRSRLGRLALASPSA
jgi:hypothetical protein